MIDRGRRIFQFPISVKACHTIMRFFGVLICACLLAMPLEAEWSQTKGPYGGTLAGLAAIESDLFAAVNGIGVYKSTDHGESWTSVNTGITNLDLRTLMSSGGNLYLGTYAGVYVSTDRGGHWTHSTTGMSIQQTNTIYATGKYLFAGTSWGIYRSEDNGTTWNEKNQGVANGLVISSFAASGTDLFFSGNYNIYKSTDYGDHWVPFRNGLTYNSPSLATLGTDIYAANAGIYRLKANDTVWTVFDGSFNPTAPLVVNGSELFAGLVGGVMHYNPALGIRELLSNGLPAVAVNQVVVAGAYMYAGTGQGLYRSSDGGQTWTVTTGLQPASINQTASSNSDLFAVSTDGLYRSSDGGDHWTFVRGNSAIKKVVPYGSYLFIGTTYGLYRSSDRGNTWKPVDMGVTNPGVLSVTSLGTALIVATNPWGVFVSTDTGATWKASNAGLSKALIVTVGVSGSLVLGGTWGVSENLKKTDSPMGPPGSGLHVSSDTCASWQWVNSGFPTSSPVIMFGQSKNSVFAALQPFTIFDENFFRSTDHGLTWTPMHARAQLGQVLSMASVNDVIFVGTDAKGVFMSKDDGTTWSPWNDGFPYTRVNDMTVSGNRLYIATEHGVWSRLLSETSFVPPQHITPDRITLFQNYPNPFNPSTTIKFQIPSNEPSVVLNIYDLVGREIATLVSGSLAAGEYNIQWNASGMPSGVYFYQLKTGAFTETKRLLLMK